MAAKAAKNRESRNITISLSTSPAVEADLVLCYDSIFPENEREEKRIEPVVLRGKSGKSRGNHPCDNWPAARSRGTEFGGGRKE
jgi:hypothetical protein